MFADFGNLNLFTEAINSANHCIIDIKVVGALFWNLNWKKEL
jgi:hypothetical protein